MSNCFVLLFLLPCTLFSQKTFKKSYPAPENALIQVNVANTAQLDVIAATRDDILVEARMEGEYQGELQLELIQDGTTVRIATRMPPSFELPNDKLSAHKVVAVELRIYLPEHLALQVFGTSCMVSATGQFQGVDIVLSSGDCRMNIQAEELQARTLSGNLTLNSPRGSVQAESQYGRVEMGEVADGSGRYELHTITGNIRILTKE